MNISLLSKKIFPQSSHIDQIQQPPDLDIDYPREDGFDLRDQQTTLQELIFNYQPLPFNSIILGLCEDRLPFVVDLTNPTPGSILIFGDPGCGKTELLASIAKSACIINSPQDLCICWISKNPDRVSHLMNYPHMQALVAPYERACGEIIVELSAIAEQRRSGRELGQTILLLIDDLSIFSEDYVDFDTLINLKWLLNHGPKSQVWPIATLSTYRISAIEKPLLHTFGTKIIGRVQLTNNLLADQSRNSPYIRSNSIRANTFITQINNSFIPFSTPIDKGGNP